MLEHLIFPEHVLTVEHVMYVSLGLLIGILLSLLVAPLAFGHGSRLAKRRMEASLPLAAGELRAEKDQLRAQFAMALRRLEQTLEQTKAKATMQIANASKKTAAVNELNQALADKMATLLTLESSDKALRDKLDATAQELAVKSASLRDVDRTIAAKESELGKLRAEVARRTEAAETYRAEIATLRTQLEASLTAISGHERATKGAERRFAGERASLAAANEELQRAQAKLVGAAARSTELERQLVAQTKEAAMLGRRVQELQAKLNEQDYMLDKRKKQIVRRRDELEMTRLSPEPPDPGSSIEAFLATTIPLKR